MPINRSRVRTSDPIPMQWGKMESIVDVPGASWSLVTNIGFRPGRYDYEAINDETGPRTTYTRPCEHVQVHTDTQSVAVPAFVRFIGSHTYNYRTTGGYTANYSSIPVRDDFSSSVDSFNRRTIREIKDEIPTSLDLPTFIGELPDLPRTLRSLRDLAALPFEGANPRKLENFREIRAIKDRLSDPVLGFNFGVMPLWNDVKNALSAQLGVDRRIDELRRTRGVLTKFKKGGTIKGTTWRDAFSPTGAIGPLGVEGRWLGGSLTRVKSGGSFYHELGGLDEYANQRAALLSALGFDNLFKSAWELVPFSFLADYFSNIGDLLGELKTNDAFTGEIQLRDTWSTERLEAYASYEVRFRHPDTGAILVGGTTCRGTKTHFTRTSGIPTTAGLLLGGNLGPRQIVNIAALV